MLIVIEGPPGAGKTSVAKALPGGTYISESEAFSLAPCLADFTRGHRDCFDPTEQFLLYAARTALKARAAMTYAHDTKMIVIDRFQTSLYVLGTVTLGLNTDFVTAMLNSGHITRGLVPDLAISLDCRYKTYRVRAERRGDESVIDASGYEQQRTAFRDYFDHAYAPGLWVDTSDLTPEQVNQEIVARLATYKASR
jgi:thymidylate kinase